ncbi:MULTISPECIES: DEAD/DEAH box helicase [unclassified Leisingera]|uniref:DEAD/DEAH box helicase n=3 Tax=Leisingera TaxID=191028 RepID=UPI0002D65408|nr:MULTISPECIES: DEAD/DEAH box helicase [unclassified Leisingera]KIC21796.1 DEAD/DEAH box helicase [Leisingera sp. ANG-S3]KID07871.1 DEAD/DEAH box helicase [Leisingera sp. ANG1]
MKQALANALQERGYETLTQVQEAVTQPDVEGRDLLVSAQTGSGKTVGFGLALAQDLLGDDEAFGEAAAPLALVIAPTRELALQVKHELGWLYREAGARIASCVGGMDMRDERRALERGAHIVAATPGRLRDHIARGSIDLSQVRGVVLDEADEMLDLGFREDLEFILGEAPEDRRTLLFSATVPPAIASLAETFQRDAMRIKTAGETKQHADIEYRLMSVAQADAENAIINVLRYYEAPSSIVFANTRAAVNRLAARLTNRGLPVVTLSGELSQTERSHALQAMRDGRARVCVATDVAARGIDLPGLELVVHAELPSNHETLLHRSGRTGRAGRKGVSALIAPPKARSKALRLLKWAKLTAEHCEAPSADDVLARDEKRMLADPVWQEPVAENEQAGVQTLLDAFTPEQIAATYLRLFRSRHSAPEDLRPADTPEPRKERKERKAFGPSVWFSLSGGREAGADPRKVLPMLCKAGNIDRDAIGAIRVQDNETFAEISKDAVEGFLKALDGKTELEPGAVLTQLAEAPELAPAPRRGPGGPKGGFKGDRKPHRGKDDGAKPYRAKSDHREDSRPPRKEWSDKPERKERSDKTAGKDWGGKPARKDWDSKPARKEDRPSKPKPAVTAKPKGASDPSKRMTRPGAPAAKPFKAKGPKPPVGKPNSKKNKARAAAAVSAKGGKGGDARPKRKPAGPAKHR